MLAGHIRGLRAAAVPAGVRRHAIRLITDVIGAGTYGAGTAQGQAIFEVAQRQFGPGEAVAWGRGVRLDPAGAALVNAAQAHAYELDDYVPAGKTHPGTVIVPTALAVAPGGTSGEELVTAIIAAYDVMVRVAYALNPNSTRGRGFHITGVSGPVGAAAAAGRLLGLDEDDLTSAIGIAASCSAGIFAFSAEGAMTKPLHAGRAAEAGIVAARLARAGFQGPTAALEADDGGLLNAFSDDPRVSELTRDLGSRFEVANTAIKPYPCCGSIHSSIDAMFELRTEHGLAASDVDSITVHNASGVILQCGFDYTGTGGPLEAQMSLQYCLAAALVDGAIGLEQFGPERRSDPQLVELAARVDFAVDPEIDATYPRGFPARVRVLRTDGKMLESRIPAPLGTPDNPIDEQGLRAKFSDLTTSSMSSSLRDQLLEVLGMLDLASDLSTVTELLETASTPPAETLEAPR